MKLKTKRVLSVSCRKSNCRLKSSHMCFPIIGGREEKSCFLFSLSLYLPFNFLTLFIFLSLLSHSVYLPFSSLSLSLSSFLLLNALFIFYRHIFSLFRFSIFSLEMVFLSFFLSIGANFIHVFLR